MTVKPIKPEETVGLKKSMIPDEVIQSFNEMIAQNMSCGRSSFKQKDVVALIASKGIDINELYEKQWLDVEDVFRAEGWIVEYDKPGFNESYDAVFTFRLK